MGRPTLYQLEISDSKYLSWTTMLAALRLSLLLLLNCSDHHLYHRSSSIRNMFPPAAAFRHRLEPSFYRSRAARFIRLVQHLIERCLTFHLDREDCVRVLAKRANIQPVVTNAVWNGLQRENPGFFDFYYEDLGRRRLMRRNRITISRHSALPRKRIPPVRAHLLFF